jgi:hypothetical protein
MRILLILIFLISTLNSCITRNPLEGSAHGVLLPLPYKKQLGDQLCWASCQEMVLNYWHKKDTAALYWNQCELARYLYYIENQQQPIDSPVCHADSVPAIYNNEWSPFNLAPIQSAYVFSTQLGTIPWDTLKSQIDSGNVVVVCMGFEGPLANSNHFVIVDGYQISSISHEPFVSYCDPWNGNYSVHKLIRYVEFANPRSEVFLDYPWVERYDSVVDYTIHIRPYHPTQ